MLSMVSEGCARTILHYALGIRQALSLESRRASDVVVNVLTEERVDETFAREVTETSCLRSLRPERPHVMSLKVPRAERRASCDVITHQELSVLG
ncbi:unnamed protein product [Danaus chrysippus]|uniref:(African queen) hypothetical protein n=1 Tax=Danaus chrysippus TaxID=151541 RepID=A0A8J2QC44_9NEOP|nr:unnamed protein product [Danaus chrysippus]